MTRNRLDQETSPYLLSHADNPVAWQPWDAKALSQAKHENKPILLSVGYAACHWCHVMAQESFQDPETAALMNALFVNIKVDREERPDLDNVYQSALAELGQSRGWPLTMFLTPARKPYGGGTYFPPKPGYGRPAFRDLLRTMAEAFAEAPEEAARTSAKIMAKLESRSHGAGDAEISATLLNHSAGQLLDGIDVVYGGFGTQAKFPHTMALELLWRAYYRTGHNSYYKAVVLTAEHMCRGGIFDHLGGGFARYTVDDEWQVPHFEKMLYDNALLIDLLTWLWQETGKPLFAERVEETVGWLLREMATEEGGFAASLAADSDGYGETEASEGVFYLWREADIDALLGADADFFKHHYGMAPMEEYPDEAVLHRIERPGGAEPAIESRLAVLRQTLRRAREERPRPERDGKNLADWNGLTIAALANAGAVFGWSDWLKAAESAFAFVQNQMEIDGRLRHSCLAGRCGEGTMLDDHASMSRAALTLYEITGEAPYLQQAESWIHICNDHFWDGDEGGYFLTPDDATAVITRLKTAEETSTPAANSVMLGILARLNVLTGKANYRERAEATIAAFSAHISANPFVMASFLNNAASLDQLLQVVIVGDPESDAAQALVRAVWDVALPNRLLVRITPGSELPPDHPAAGKSEINGLPAAYLCIGMTCRLPLTDPDSLREALQDRELLSPA